MKDIEREMAWGERGRQRRGTLCVVACTESWLSSIRRGVCVCVCVCVCVFMCAVLTEGIKCVHACAEMWKTNCEL